MMTLQEWLKQVYPMLAQKAMTRVENVIDEGKITAYWAGTIIRIDIKPERD